MVTLTRTHKHTQREGALERTRHQRQYSCGGTSQADTSLCIYRCVLSSSQIGGRAVDNLPAFEEDGHLIGESGLIQICAKMSAVLGFNALYVMNNCINQALAICFP